MSFSSLRFNPLVQFFAAGAVIFSLYSFYEKPEAASTDAITINIAEQENLASLFEKTWRRPPTPVELEGLIESRVREELFYREALALGLDDGDVIVRRRLAQKIEFISDDLAVRREPTDEELSAFLKENAEKYAIEPSITFRQIYLNTDRRGPGLMDDAGAILAELERGADPLVLGDVIELPQAMEEVTVSQVSRVFGNEFAEAAGHAEPGAWFGPIRSAYGAHLVKLVANVAGRAPTLDEARKAIERDWREAQRQQARAAYTEALKGKYRITVEQAEPSGE